MHLTTYADYSLRTLIYLAAHPGEYVSTQEIAQAYDVSNNHLIKVVHNLGQQGFLDIKRGRHGGIALSRDPAEINVGEVIRKSEPGFDIVECFDPDSDCPIIPVCGLKPMLNEAVTAFLEVLDSYTLADIMGGKRKRNYGKYFHPVS